MKIEISKEMAVQPIGFDKLSNSVKSVWDSRYKKYMHKVEKIIKKIEDKKLADIGFMNEYIYDIICMGFTVKQLFIILKEAEKGVFFSREMLQFLIPPPKPISLENYYSSKKTRYLIKLLKLIFKKNE